MNYIKYINLESNLVELGGQFATQSMIDSGWFEYHGEIPPNSTNLYDFIDGVLTPHVIIKPNSSMVKEYKKYLSDTDYKMLPNYVPKEGENLDDIISKRNEAREFIRANSEVPNYNSPETMTSTLTMTGEPITEYPTECVFDGT